MYAIRSYYENVVHVDGRVDPLRDIDVIQTELNLADLDSVEKRIARTEKQAKSGDKKMQAELDLTARRPLDLRGDAQTVQGLVPERDQDV